MEKNSVKKVRVTDIIKKKNKEKIVALTAYDYTMAKILDDTGIDIILIGDSAANVIMGYKTTLPINVKEMLVFTEAVSRGVKRALVVADMPFLSYQISLEEGVKNAGLFLKKGAEAVKIEGASLDILKLIEKLVSDGVPVMGHIGLTPQSIHFYGGYRVVGKDRTEEKKLIEGAKKLEEAGCFSLVLEKIPLKLAKKITKILKIPTIGIGAGPYCDGQILVINDLLGMDPSFSPKYVRRYADLYTIIGNAVKKFKEDVKKGNFPSEKESF